MRVVNDKENAQQPIEVGLLALFTHSMFCAFGFVSALLAPLAVLMAHLRLTNPWPRVSALIGAVIAIALFQVPLPLVVVAFVVSLFIADSVVHEGSFWGTLGSTLLVSLMSVFAMLVVSAKVGRVDVASQWVFAIDSVLNEAKAVISVEQRAEVWALLRQTLIVEGPFLLLVGVMISFWLCIGVSAHLGWVAEPHRYSGKSLRALRLPKWVAGIFVGLLVASYFARADLAFLVSGVERVVGTILFIQGMVFLSNILNGRSVVGPMRALIYSIALTFGFYVIVGLGVMGSWSRFQFQRRKI